MNLVYAIKEFVNEAGEKVQYKQLYIVTPRGYRVPVKPCYKEDKRLLLECAEEAQESK